jgi:hypothetical protein
LAFYLAAAEIEKIAGAKWKQKTARACARIALQGGE